MLDCEQYNKPMSPQEEDMNSDSEELQTATATLLVQATRFNCDGRHSGDVLDLGPTEADHRVRGELQRLEAGENPVLNLQPRTIIEIFRERISVPGPDSFTADMDNQLKLTQIQSVVMSLKQHYSVIESASLPCGSNLYKQLDLQIASIKDEIAKCLTLLKYLSYTLSKSPVDYTQWLSNLVSEIMLYQDKLSEFPSIHLDEPASSDYLHTWLEIRWSLIVMVCHLRQPPPNLHLIQTNINHADKPLSWLEQIILATMFDLAELAKRRPESQIYSRGLGCICIEDLWFCIHRISKSKDIDFWRLLGLMITPKTTDPEPDCEYLQYYTLADDKATLFWSLLGRLVVNTVKVSGKDELQLGGLNLLIKQQLKSLLRVEQTEAVLRLVLNVLLVIFKLVEPNLELLAEVWNYYAGRLNSTFWDPTSNTLDGTVFIPKSAVVWQAKVECLAKGEDRDSLDSYALFLQLVAVSTLSWTNNKPKDNAKFRARVCQKLPETKCALLNECGVYHVGTLIAVIQNITHQELLTETMLSNMAGLLDNVGTSANLTQICLLFKMTIGLCCLEKEMSILPVGRSISHQMSRIVRNFVENQSDVHLRRAAHDAIKVYLEFVEAVFTVSVFQHDVSILFDVWLEDFLNICSSTEISSVFKVFNVGLNRCRTRYQLVTNQNPESNLEGLQSLITKLDLILQPVLRNIIYTLTCPPGAIDIAFEFLVLLMEVRARGHSFLRGSVTQTIVSYTNLNHQGAMNNNIKDELRVFFLSRLTSIPGGLDKMVSTLNDSNAKVLKDILLVAVGQCCLTVGRQHKSYKNLQDCWLKLSALYDLVPLYSEEKEEELALVVLSQLANNQHTEVLYEMCNGVETLKKANDKTTQLYQVAGWMAKHCMHLIYRSDRPGKGFQLLMSTLLTSRLSLGGSWNPHSAELRGVSICIPLFLKSIFAWKDLKSDMTLQRNIDEITRIYINWYTPSSHPLLFIFRRNGFKSTSTESKELVLDLVCDRLKKLLLYQDFPSEPEQQENHQKQQVQTAQNVLQLLSCGLDNVDSDVLSHLITKLLQPSLDITLRDDAVLRRESGVFIKKLVKCIFSQQQQENVRVLQSLLNDQLVKLYNSHLEHESKMVFSTLAALVEFRPTILDPTWSDLQRVVRRIQERKGTGNNMLQALEEIKSKSNSNN